jgi:hypothetical protein
MGPLVTRFCPRSLSYVHTDIFTSLTSLHSVVSSLRELFVRTHKFGEDDE